MGEEEARQLFRALRWHATGGDPVCPACGCLAVYEYRCRPLWKCKACGKQFSVTSGTIFHSRKLPFRDYLMAIALFVNGVKGKSALELGRDLDVPYKAAYVPAHKLREAMGADQDKGVAKGEVEIDGAYFAGAHNPHPRASGSHVTTPFALGFRPCTISGGGRPPYFRRGFQNGSRRFATRKMHAAVRRARIMRPSLSWRRSSRLLASSQAQSCSTMQRTVPSPDPCGCPTSRMKGWMPSRAQSPRLSALSPRSGSAGRRAGSGRVGVEPADRGADGQGQA